MKTYLLLFLIMIPLLSGCSLVSQAPVQTPTSDIPVGHFYFYATNCPHCATVSQYVTEHAVKQKTFYIEREVSADTSNRDLLIAVGKKCGISAVDLAVPLFWDGKQCYQGADQVTSYFETIPQQ